MAGCLGCRAAFIPLDSLPWQLTEEEGGRYGGGFPGSLNTRKGGLNVTVKWLKSGNMGPATLSIFLVFSTCQHRANFMFLWGGTRNWNYRSQTFYRWTSARTGLQGRYFPANQNPTYRKNHTAGTSKIRTISYSGSWVICRYGFRIHPVLNSCTLSKM